MSKPLVVITGGQRSGTSFMAHFLKLCGYDLGTEYWDARLDGGFESPDVCNYYRDILGTDRFPFTRYWIDTPEHTSFRSFLHLQDYYRVVKFSYLLMDLRLLSSWLHSRGTGDFFLVMDRPAEKVVTSKDSRKEIFYEEDWEGLHITADEFRERKEKALSLFDQHGVSYSRVVFPVINFSALHNIVTNAGLELPANAPEVFNQLYDPKKIHF